MSKEILELFKKQENFAVHFDSYEEACDLLKLLEVNTNIRWASMDKPTTYCSYFIELSYYLVFRGGCLYRYSVEYSNNIVTKHYKYSELVIEPPKCFKRL